ncbi:hypothetical protein QTP86_017433, partial [Hemibagrus guttatus]
LGHILSSSAPQGEIECCLSLAIGVTNQRETTLVWDKETGEPLYNAIVWLDLRTQSTVEHLIEKTPGKNKNHFKHKTGLPISTYFSAVKLRWLMDNVVEVEEAVRSHRAMFGTVDSWLIWSLTGGKNGGIHCTDITNASRTMLFNIHTMEWDLDLCRYFEVPVEILPEVRSSSEIYGYMSSGSLVGVPISGTVCVPQCLGDQSAALVGQMCFKDGQTKNTYGTGCFMLKNTGVKPVMSEHGLLTTVAYKLGKDRPAHYALEGSVAIAGAVVRWLKDNLGILKSSSEIETLAAEAGTSYGCYFVPAFSGLYAPYWEPSARGTLNSAWRNLYAEAVPDRDFQGFGEEPETVVDDIVSMGKTMGLEVNDDDIEELVEEHWQELTTEEVQELQKEQQREAMEDQIICGLTQFTNRSHLAFAALEAVCFQTREVLDAMNRDSGASLTQLQVDGGMTANKLLMQLQADILCIPVVRPYMSETTALGAAMAAGAAEGVNVWKINPEDMTCVTSEKYQPQIKPEDFTGIMSSSLLSTRCWSVSVGIKSEFRYARWKKAVQKAMNWETMDPLPNENGVSSGYSGFLSKSKDMHYQVRCELRKIKARKASGLDGISPRLLRDCADQLCGVVRYMFNLSPVLEKVPMLWKTSCVVPVPKTAHPRELNHFRPVALTSHLMKTMERIIPCHLHSSVSTVLDPLQFAYRPGIGVDDAVIYLLHWKLTHLESTGSTVRVAFFDFSSAFNTIQPTLLHRKLERSGMEDHLAAWIIDYLTNRPQYVRLRDCVSEVVVCNTGAPQGTVLSPFLFTLYTSDFRYNTNACHLQKFSDDSAIVGCVSDGNEQEYRDVIKDFVDWCECHHLHLNTNKMKEMVIDFQRRRTPHHTPVTIQGLDIELVGRFKYLGVHLNNRLDWLDNTDALYKKGQSHLHLLRRLGSFGVSRTLLWTFYDTVVASTVLYVIVCWVGGSTERNRKRMNRLVRRASSVLGCPLELVEEVGERRMLAKLRSIMNNTSHPLYGTVEILWRAFSSRLLHPQYRKERYHRSFIPAAVRLYNIALHFEILSFNTTAEHQRYPEESSPSELSVWTVKPVKEAKSCDTKETQSHFKAGKMGERKDLSEFDEGPNCDG